MNAGQVYVDWFWGFFSHGNNLAAFHVLNVCSTTAEVIGHVNAK